MQMASWGSGLGSGFAEKVVELLEFAGLPCSVFVMRFN